MNYKLAKKITPYLFITPPILAVLCLVAFPVFYAFYISFFDWNLLAQDKPFIGLGNYIKVLQENRFQGALYNTLYFVVAYVFSVNILGLILALIAQGLKGFLRSTVRITSFIPVITSMVAVSIVWIWLYQPTFGLFNHMLGKIGLGPYNWLKDPKLAMPSIIMMTVWKYVGFTMIIYIAGLVNIPEQYYDAAKVDGANSWNTIRYITLPLLKNVTVFLFATGVIGAFQVFVQTFIMTRGGPGTATNTIVLEIYFRGFQFLRMGEASSLAFILFGIILIATILQLKYFHSDIIY